MALSATAEEVAEHFTKTANSYEKDTQGVTLEINKRLIALASPPFSSSSIIHDCACGPGTLIAEIQELASPPQKIEATDLAQGMIDSVSLKIKENDWTNVKAQVMNGQELAFPDESFTHSTSTFGIFMFPDSKRGLAEAFRTLKPKGWFGITSWHCVGWMRPCQVAWSKINPTLPPMKNQLPVAWREIDSVKTMLMEVGFKDVGAEMKRAMLNKPSVGALMDTFWPMLKKMIPELRAMSDEDYEEFKVVMLEELKDGVIHNDDGSVGIPMDSIIAYGIKA